jgi:hypothetical protein
MLENQKPLQGNRICVQDANGCGMACQGAGQQQGDGTMVETGIPHSIAGAPLSFELPVDDLSTMGWSKVQLAGGPAYQSAKPVEVDDASQTSRPGLPKGMVLKPGGGAGASKQRPGRALSIQSSSAEPAGISLICLRPSLISNSSPGLRSSMAV